jgi:carboxynorspermidine decarboxylase
MIAAKVECPTTPAFIFSPSRALSQIHTLRNALRSTNCKLLYSVKACSLLPALEVISPWVDGFSVSSPFEAKLVALAAPGASVVHLVCPSLDGSRLAPDARISHVTLNSSNQWARVKSASAADVRSWGIRVNPEQSVVADARYDPCRKYSKLGMTISHIQEAWRLGELNGLSGLHLHIGCLCESWSSLRDVALRLASELSPLMSGVEWINLGGGYVWDADSDFTPLADCVRLLSENYGLEVFLEPGAGIINDAVCLVASVVDLLEREGKTIAILDTSVNHLPEVFEYQFEPDVAEHCDGAPNEYILAGASCLSGDIFGNYAFKEPLKIGSRLTFQNVGAYTLVKANMFNGINLPSIYTLDEHGEFALIREFTFDDFAARCGADVYKHADI